MTLLPLAPFRQRMRVRAYGSRWLPSLVGRLLMYFIMSTVNQDRQYAARSESGALSQPATHVHVTHTCT
jgi:hypothetical protein